MHRAAQGRHYSTAPESNQWQSRAVIIQGGISCYRLFLPYIKKTTADLFMVGYQQAQLPPSPLGTRHGGAAKGQLSRRRSSPCAAASPAGIPQLVLREGKGSACVSKEHGLPRAALQQCWFPALSSEACQQG